MNTVETIQQKVVHLPPQAQAEVLEAVEQIEERYHGEKLIAEQNGDEKTAHPLELLGRLPKIDAPPDFAERHDFYAHGKLDD